MDKLIDNPMTSTKNSFFLFTHEGTFLTCTKNKYHNRAKMYLRASHLTKNTFVNFSWMKVGKKLKQQTSLLSYWTPASISRRVTSSSAAASAWKHDASLILIHYRIDFKTILMNGTAMTPNLGHFVERKRTELFTHFYCLCRPKQLRINPFC